MDWDEKLIDIAAERIKAELREDPRENPATLLELFNAAEIAKKTLTERNKTTMYVNHLGSRHKVEITRQEFEETTAALLGRTRTTTEIVVRQAHLKWADIDIVLLVGGSTRMPMVQRMLEEISGKPPERSVSPDAAVAHGAALYADLLLEQKSTNRRGAHFSVSNVNSHSLGIVGVDKTTGRRRNQVLIPKNTPLPHTTAGTFKTAKPNQTNVLIRIVEGESERPEACSQIGANDAHSPFRSRPSHSLSGRSNSNLPSWCFLATSQTEMMLNPRPSGRWASINSRCRGRKRGESPTHQYYIWVSRRINGSPPTRPRAQRGRKDRHPVARNRPKGWPTSTACRALAPAILRAR